MKKETVIDTIYSFDPKEVGFVEDFVSKVLDKLPDDYLINNKICNNSEECSTLRAQITVLLNNMKISIECKDLELNNKSSYIPKCKCYDEKTERCFGTKEIDPCSCRGDKRECNFYNNVKKNGLDEVKSYENTLNTKIKDFIKTCAYCGDLFSLSPHCENCEHENFCGKTIRIYPSFWDISKLEKYEKDISTLRDLKEFCDNHLTCDDCGFVCPFIDFCNHNLNKNNPSTW